MIVTSPSPAFDKAREAWTSRRARYPPERVMPGSVTRSVDLTACRIMDPKPTRTPELANSLISLHPNSFSFFHRPRAANQQQASASHMERAGQPV
jgi:hypothetical protein